MARLKRDYSNWWELAGDLYADEFGGDRVQAQRMVFELQRANPGINRFYRGMSIKKPEVPRGGPVITHEQMAAARGESPEQYLGALQEQLGTLPGSALDFAEQYGVQGLQQPPPQAGALPEGVPGVTEAPQPPGPQDIGAGETAYPPGVTGTPAWLTDLDIYSYFYGPQAFAQPEFPQPRSFDVPLPPTGQLNVPGNRNLGIAGGTARRRTTPQPYDYSPEDIQSLRGVQQQPTTPSWLRAIGYTRSTIGVPGGIPREQLEPRVRRFQERQAAGVEEPEEELTEAERIRQQPMPTFEEGRTEAPMLADWIQDPVTGQWRLAEREGLDWLTHWVSQNTDLSDISPYTDWMLQYIGYWEPTEQQQTPQGTTASSGYFTYGGRRRGRRGGRGYSSYTPPSYSAVERRQDRRPGFMYGVMWRI